MANHANDRTSPSSTNELTVWLRDGWKVMLKHFPALVLIALVADLPLAYISRAAESIDNGLVSTLVTLSTIAMITPLAKATAIVAIDTWERGETGAVLGAFGALIRNLPVLLAASTLWCIGVFIGAGLVIVPGIIVLVLGQCLMGAVILENRSLKDATRRSRALVWPRFWNVLALFLIVQAVAGIASGILEAAAGTTITGLPLDIITRALTSPIAFAPLAMMFLRVTRGSDTNVAQTE